MNEFESLLAARVVIGDWKDEYNQYHRHSSLGYATPSEYAARCGCVHEPSAGEAEEEPMAV